MGIDLKDLLSYWTPGRKSIQVFIFVILSGSVACDKDDNQGLISDTGLCLVENNGVFEEIELDEAPEYLDGGFDGLVSAIGGELTYPAEARENDIEGTCLIDYEITEDGRVENIVATQDPGGGIGDSAASSIESATSGISFSPGILNNNPVRVKKEIRILYRLE